MLWSALYSKLDSWSATLGNGDSWKRYSIAYLLFLLAFLSRLLILPMDGGYPFLTFFPAAILAFFLCGQRPGFVCAILSGVCGYYFFEPPIQTWIPTYQSMLSGFGYIFSVWLVGNIISASRRHARNAVQLQKELGERTLQEANENLQLAMDSAQLGIWNWDVTAGSVHCSKRTLECLGVAKNQKLNYARFCETVHPEDRQRVDSQVADCLRNHSSLDLEFRVVWPDGSVHWMAALGRSFFADDSTAQHMQGVVRDVTMRRILEQSVVEHKHMLEQLAEAMPHIVWASDRQGRNIYSNGHWTRYTGVAASESFDHGWLLSVHPDDQALSQPHWERAVSSQSAFSFESRIRRHDGLYRWFLVRGVPVLDTHGNTDRWYGTCTDIHDLKTAQQELAASRAEALEEVKALRGLVNICAWCRKTLDENGSWVTIEEYVQRHSAAVFSHGICPTCQSDAITERMLARKAKGQG